MTFFPVPDEFYRDLLYLGWSAEEYALWAIAGSWSADRLTDGLVPIAALALFPPFASSAADALVARGIWKRARGGYQYAMWPRECSRAVVLAKREREKLKKQRQRAGYAHDPEGNTSSGDVSSPGDNLGDTPGTDTGTTSGSPGPSSNPVVPTEQNNQPPSGVGARGPTRVRAKATRIPEDFAVTHEMVAWAQRETPLVDGRRETAAFIDYWRGKAGRNATKLDWVATWRNWMRKAQGDAEERRPAPRNGVSHTSSGSARMDKALAALVDDDPFRDQYSQQPPNTIDGLVIIEGGRSA